MKSFAAFVFVGLLAVAVAVPFTEEQMKKAQEHVKKCLEETGADPAVVGQLKQGDFSNQDETTKCFTLCFLREAGMVDAAGNQIAAVIIEKLSASHDKAKVEALVEKCKNEGGDTPCSKAYNTYKCYRSAVEF